MGPGVVRYSLFFVLALLLSPDSSLALKPPMKAILPKKVLHLQQDQIFTTQLDDIPIVQPTTPTGTPNTYSPTPTTTTPTGNPAGNPTTQSPPTGFQPNNPTPFPTGPSGPAGPTGPDGMTGPVTPTGPGGQSGPPTGTGGQSSPPTGTGGQSGPPTGTGGQSGPPTGPGGQSGPTGPSGSSSGGSWCVASSSASETALQVGLDYACGYGGADCSQIQPGASCYNPNTVRDHASYAFNAYYQKNPAPTSCTFGGAAQLTNTDPSSGSCHFSTGKSGGMTPPTPPMSNTPPTTYPTSPTAPGGGFSDQPGYTSSEPTGEPSSADSIGSNLLLPLMITSLLVFLNREY